MTPPSKTACYPPSEFLRDFEEWQKSRMHHDPFVRAKLLFSVRYPQQKIFAYRFNRFGCVVKSSHTQLPALIQDRIALPGKDGSGYVPEELLLALHDWYCGLSDAAICSMPAPDWSAVLEIYERLSK